MAENKRWRQKLGGKYPYKRPLGGGLSGKPLLGGSSTALKKQATQNMNNNDSDNKTPLKKKNTMNFKRSQNGNFPTDTIDFAKQRKNSLLIGGTREDQ